MQDGMFNLESLGTVLEKETHTNTDAGKIAPETAAAAINKGDDSENEAIAAAEKAANGGNSKTAEEIAAEEAKGKEGKTAEELAAETAATAAKKAQEVPEHIATMLKDAGFDSVEQMVAAAKKSKEVPAVEATAEEKKAITDAAEAKFLSFAITNKKLTPDYLSQAQTLSSDEGNKNIVLDEFTKEYLAKNEDADIDDAEFAFNTRYGIGSKDEAVAESGQKLLELHKAALLGEKMKGYNEAKSEYEELSQIEAAKPLFDQMLKEVTAVPAEIVIGKDGETGQTTFKSTVTQKQILEHINTKLGKDFLLEQFSDFLGGQQGKAREVVQKVVEMAHKSMVFDQVVAAHGETMRAIGLRDGSIGGKAPFRTEGGNVSGSSVKENAQDLGFGG